MEDGLPEVGFNFFDDDDNFEPIANQIAVERTAGKLLNKIAYDNAFDKLGTAVDNVQMAAERKALRDARDVELSDEIQTQDGVSDLGDDFLA